MTVIQRPDKMPEWASVDQNDPKLPRPNVGEPPASKKQAGWFYEEPPPANWLNWLQRYYHRWIAFFDDQRKYQKSFVDGLILSNNIISPLTDIACSIGSCTDAAKTTVLVNELEGFTKKLSVVWEAGSANGGRASAVSLTANTWYHFFIIGKTDGTIDFGFDTSVVATNLLADAVGFIYFKRIGSVLTNVSSNIIAFHEQPDHCFYWKVNNVVLSAAPTHNLWLDLVLATPKDVVTEAQCNVYLEPATGTGSESISFQTKQQGNADYNMCEFAWTLKTSTFQVDGHNNSEIHTDTNSTIQIYRDVPGTPMTYTMFKIAVIRWKELF